jgi:hypothetical protein
MAERYGAPGKCYWNTFAQAKVWALWTMQTEGMIFSLVRIKI